MPRVDVQIPTPDGACPATLHLPRVRAHGPVCFCSPMGAE